MRVFRVRGALSIFAKVLPNVSKTTTTGPWSCFKLPELTASVIVILMELICRSLKCSICRSVVGGDNGSSVEAGDDSAEVEVLEELLRGEPGTVSPSKGDSVGGTA